MQRTGARVLVVDDEENLRRTVRLGLRLEGFEVEVAASGEEALQVLRAVPIHFAIVDLMMPGVNGLDLARQLRRLHPEVRVVLTSAYHLSERQLERADCGAMAFLPKPFVLAELAEFLRAKLAPRAGLAC